eukprot:g79671.t1
MQAQQGLLIRKKVSYSFSDLQKVAILPVLFVVLLSLFPPQLCWPAVTHVLVSFFLISSSSLLAHLLPIALVLALVLSYRHFRTTPVSKMAYPSYSPTTASSTRLNTRTIGLQEKSAEMHGWLAFTTHSSTCSRSSSPPVSSATSQPTATSSVSTSLCCSAASKESGYAFFKTESDMFYVYKDAFCTPSMLLGQTKLAHLKYPPDLLCVAHMPSSLSSVHVYIRPSTTFFARNYHCVDAISSVVEHGSRLEIRLQLAADAPCWSSGCPAWSASDPNGEWRDGLVLRAASEEEHAGWLQTLRRRSDLCLQPAAGRPQTSGSEARQAAAATVHSSTAGMSGQQQLEELWHYLEARALRAPLPQERLSWPAHILLSAKEVRPTDVQQQTTPCTPAAEAATRHLAPHTTSLLTTSHPTHHTVCTATPFRNPAACPENIVTHVLQQDYSELLQTRLDLRDAKKERSLCRHGVVFRARLDWTPEGPFRYTGLLSGSIPCLIRMSSALASVCQLGYVPRWLTGSLAEANLFPCVAIKCLRGAGVPSGNLLFLGRKTGQPEHDFFAHSLSTHATERLSLPLLPILRAFKRYSRYPLQTGLSDLAAWTQLGEPVQQAVFPWCLGLRPIRNLPGLHSLPGPDPADNFVAQLLQLPAGRPLFDVLALDLPTSTQPRLVGRVTLESHGLVSDGSGGGLFFHHVLKEEDYALRPQWQAQLNRYHTHSVGWELFE